MIFVKAPLNATRENAMKKQGAKPVRFAQTRLLVCAIVALALLPQAAYAFTANATIAGGATWVTSRTQSVAVSASSSNNITWARVTDANGNFPDWAYIGGGKTVSYTITNTLYPVGGAIYGMQVQFMDSTFGTGAAYDTVGVDLDDPVITTPTIASPYTTSNSVTFHWTASDATSGIADYYMLVGTFPGGSDKFSGWIGSQPGSYTIGNCSDGVTYYCQMLAKDNAGRTSALTASSPGIRVDLTNPSTPGKPTAGNVFAPATVTFQWLPSLDMSGVAYYIVEIRNWPDWPTLPVSGTTTGNSYSFPGVDGNSYFCRVRAVDNAGRLSDMSENSDGVLCDAAAPPAPGAPTGYYYGTTVSFDWDEVADVGVGSGIAGYNVQVWDDLGNYLANGDIGNVTSHAVTGALGRTYYCRVKAYDAMGNRSAYSATSAGVFIPVPDTTPPTGTVAIAGGALYTNTQAVTLALSATDTGGSSGGTGVVWMRVSNTGSTWATYAYAASLPWTLAAGDGLKTVQVKFGDGAGNWSNPYTTTITLDKRAPKGTLTINGGAAYTAGPSVTLSSAATDATSGLAQMRFSNDNAAWTTFSYAANKAWTLSAGDGVKTVYAQYKDHAGNWSASTSASIVMDSEAPVITLLGDTAMTVAKNGTFTDPGATAIDAIDGDLTAQIVKNSNVNTAVVGDYSVTYDVNDAAGNAASQQSRTVHVAAYSGPVIDLPVPSIDFGPRLPDAGPTAAVSLQVRNIGDALMKLKGVLNISGPAAADFKITKIGFTTAGVKPGASIYVQLTFDPSATGSRDAVLTIPTNAVNVPTMLVPLTGVGLESGEIALNVSKTGHGTVQVTPPSGPYRAGDNVILTAVPEASWSFAGWSGDVSGSVNPKTITLAGDTDVVAHFTGGQQSDFEVDVIGQGDVTIDPPTGPYYVGDSVTLTATAATDWNFAGWSGAIGGAANPVSLTLGASTTVVATFTQQTRTLTLSTVGQGSIEADSNPPYAVNDTVLLTAVPADGWDFVGWSGGTTGTANPLPVTMDVNKAIAANFQLKISANTSKYWQYRQRLTSQYLLVGAGQGYSLPAEFRNTLYNFIKFSDTTCNLGWYIGMLATEFHMLSHPEIYPNFNMGDANRLNQTKTELYYALLAMDRLDVTGESVGFAWGIDTPGFFIRDDVYAGFNGNFGMGGMESDLTSTNIKNKEMSQDQVYHVLIGLSLVKRFVPAGTVVNGYDLRQGAINRAYFIVTWVKTGGWRIKNPSWDWNSYVMRGDDARAYSHGLNKELVYITDGLVDYVGSVDSAYKTLWNQAWQPFLYPSTGSGPDNLHMVMSIAAIGNGWGNDTLQHLMSLKAVQNYYLYPYLYAALWPHVATLPNWPGHHNTLDAETLPVLASAPASGPADDAAPGWRTANKFMDSIDQQNNGGAIGNRYNGLDFMLMHNLFYIVSPNWY